MSKSSSAAIAAAAFAAFAVACGDLPVGTDGLPSFKVAGNSGCYTVKFNSQESGVFPSFSGTTTGDLEATAVVEFDVGTIVTPGVVFGAEGVATYRVTGGIIPELVGKDFRTSVKFVTTAGPDNEPLILNLVGRERALEGVAKANLTFHGTLDVRNNPTLEVDIVYHGVICP